VRTVDDARRWVDHGTKLFLEVVAYDGSSTLPGWTRKHLVAHVAANADALVNLAHWAATGVPTPMYASPDARAAGIERGLAMSVPELDSWLHRSASTLATSLQLLTDQQWAAEVVTAQGRTVPATEVPWLRAREVYVHTVDLDLGVTFADLPTDFLEALCADVVAKRGTVPDPDPDAPLAQRAAWLTGRRHQLSSVPDLGPWL
jgi:maleylpyruvate isomerase